jgi:hypothetical protein
MTVVALLVPALIAMADPAGLYLREVVPDQRKNDSDRGAPPRRSTNHESRAPEQNVSAAQQEKAPVAIGRLQSSGAVFVNDAAAPADTTVFERDVVRTGGDGMARLAVSERGAILIAANSKVSFVASWRYFASLLAGKISYSAFPGAARFQLNIGQFVLTPSVDAASAADIEMAADGSAVVQATQGSMGIIALEGPLSLFLQSGQAARITPKGEVLPIATQGAPGGQQLTAPENPPPGTQPKPEGTPQPPGKPSGHHGAIILGVAAAAAAGVALAAKGKSNSGAPVSPSSP